MTTHAVIGSDVRTTLQGFRFFASPIDEPRARRATDIFLLSGTSIALIFLALTATPPSAFEQALIELAASLPSFLDGVWQLLLDLLTVWALALLALALIRGRKLLLRDMLLAAAVALVVSLVLTRVTTGSWPD